MKKTFFAFILILLSTSPAFAARYDIKEMTPEIQQALSNRQSRYGELQSSKAQGALGENSQGYVGVLNPADGAEALASAENADRKTIYSAIVSQNGLPAGGLAQVEAVFGEVQRDKAKPGESIQLPSGEWTKK